MGEVVSEAAYVVGASDKILINNTYFGPFGFGYIAIGPELLPEYFV
jgi:hypothetical protein